MLFDYDALLEWFDQSKRDLPWRQNPTPYQVWISEVMLQQTKASYVIDYFSRWIQSFPTLASLAHAPLDQVIKQWEGLGYYQRARNLHIAAKQIMAEWGGEIPSCLEKLQKIRGLGPYTTRAILAFGFQQKHIAIDGNVKRVLSRLYMIAEDLTKRAGMRQIEKIAQDIEGKAPSYRVAEAFIELGALICQKTPRCEICPLQKRCKAYEQGKVALYPNLAPKEAPIPLQRAVFLIEHENHLLVRKEKEKKVMEDLYEFLYEEYIPQGGIFWQEQLKKRFSSSFSFHCRLPLVKHTFTRYKVTLYPFHMMAPNFFCPSGFEWIDKNQVERLPFSSGHRKILKHFLENLCVSCN